MANLIKYAWHLTLSLLGGLSKETFKTTSKLQLFSSVTSQLFTLTVRFCAHSKAKSLSFHLKYFSFFIIIIIKKRLSRYTKNPFIRQQIFFDRDSIYIQMEVQLYQISGKYFLFVSGFKVLLYFSICIFRFHPIITVSNHLF